MRSSGLAMSRIAAKPTEGGAAVGVAELCYLNGWQILFFFEAEVLCDADWECWVWLVGHKVVDVGGFEVLAFHEFSG